MYDVKIIESSGGGISAQFPLITLPTPATCVIFLHHHSRRKFLVRPALVQKQKPTDRETTHRGMTSPQHTHICITDTREVILDQS